MEKWGYVTRSSKEPTTFSCCTKNIWSGFLDNIGNISKVDNRDIKARPLVNPEAIADGFGSHGQPCLSTRGDMGAYIAG